MLEGHKLSLQLSRAKAAAPEGKKGGKKETKEEGTTKVVVRNVAFEATRKVGSGATLQLTLYVYLYFGAIMDLASLFSKSPVFTSPHLHPLQDITAVSAANLTACLIHPSRFLNI